MISAKDIIPLSQGQYVIFNQKPLCFLRILKFFIADAIDSKKYPVCSSSISKFLMLRKCRDPKASIFNWTRIVVI